MKRICTICYRDNDEDRCSHCGSDTQLKSHHGPDYEEEKGDYLYHARRDVEAERR